MKLFVAILCISTCLSANGLEERCVRLRDCPPLLKKFKDQGPSILKNYQTCGPIQHDLDRQTYQCPDVSRGCRCRNPVTCPDLRPYVLEKNFGMVDNYRRCKFINKTLYHCCPIFRPKKIDLEDISLRLGFESLDFQKPASENNELVKGYLSTFQSKCGRSDPTLTLRIIGGRLAEEEDFPWLAAIGKKGNDNEDFIVFCAGSLITDRHILTAAHCVQHSNLEYIVRLGDTNIRSDDVLEFSVEQISVHPGFLHTDAGLRNDIAVLKLSRNVKSSSRVRPICLATKKGSDQDDIYYGKAEVAGWGATARSLRSDDLRVLVQSVLSQDNCAKYFNITKFRPSSTHVCAMGSNSLLEDSCRGDSGAPLMFRREDESYEVIGITSFGSNKCDSSTPTVFARVESFLKWIEFVVTDSILRDKRRI